MTKEEFYNLQSKWIEFHFLRDTGKTKVWEVITKPDPLKHPPTVLGYVKWFGRWRCYSFYPESDMIFEKQCLRDLANFCEERTGEHRKVKK